MVIAKSGQVDVGPVVHVLSFDASITDGLAPKEVVIVYSLVVSIISFNDNLLTVLFQPHIYNERPAMQKVSFESAEEN